MNGKYVSGQDEDKKMMLVILGKRNFSGRWKPNCSLLANGDEVEHLRSFLRTKVIPWSK